MCNQFSKPCLKLFWQICCILLQTTKQEELHLRIEQGQRSITEFNQAIDMMRISRDAKICDIEKLQAEVEVNTKFGFSAEEKA